MCIGRTTCRFKKRVEKRQTHRSVDALITRRLKALIKPVEQEQGLSLVEIVVSVMLLGLMATGLLAAIDAGFRASLAIEDQTTSANLVTSQLEDILARAYVEPADYPTVELPDGFSLSFDNFVIVPTLLERITIAVSNAVEELFSITTRKVNTAFVASPPTQLLSQREFRWYENNASTTPVTSLADESTSFTINTLGQTVRLRMSVQVLTVALDTSTQAFRLQYSTDTGGPWADVGAFASTTSTWIGFNNPGVADGDSNSSPLLSTSDVFESYEEENPSVSNPRAVSADEVAEWDWVLQENAAAFNTNYFFRMVEEDGTELGSYTRFPVVAMPPPISYDQFDYRWYQNADSIIPGPALAAQRVALATTTRYDAYRLRMNVAVDGIDLETSTQAFRLEYATSTLGTWRAVGAPASTSEAWIGIDNASVADGASNSTTTLSGSTVFQSYEESNPTVANTKRLAVDERGEWDWTLQDDSAATNTTYFFRMVLENGTTLDNYSFYPTLTTPPDSLFDQQHYRWYENTGLITPTVPSGATNTAISSVAQGQTIRLRINVELSAAGVSAELESFVLQYATSTTSTWTNLGAPASGETWRGSDNPTTTDGATLPVLLLATSTVAQSYEEQNPSTSTPNLIGIGDFAEWDWVVQNNAAEPESSYFFRMAQSDGTPFDTYTRYPEASTAEGGLIQQDYRWYANRNHPDPIVSLAPENSSTTDVELLEVVRLRTNIRATGAQLDAGALTLKVQFATSTGGPWTDVGATTSAEIWRGFRNSLVEDGTAIGDLLLTQSNVLETYEEANPSAPNPNALSTGDYGEWDWVLENNSAPADTYFFRMLESDDTPLDSYVNYPQLATVDPTLTQEDYRWYVNGVTLNPTSSLAALNQLTTGAAPGDVFRLRMNVEVADFDLPATGEAFKLQFTGGNTSTGPWTDVGGLGSASIWRGFSNGLTDGASITALLTSTLFTAVGETYEEENPSVSNPNAVLVTTTPQRGEWDWVLEDRLAPSNTYFFRMVRSDGAELEGYTNYPTLVASGPSLSQADYRWFSNAASTTPGAALAAENTEFVGAEQVLAYRLRMNVAVSAVGLDTSTQAFNLQYTTDTSTGPWLDLGGLGSTSTWRGFDNPGVADSAAITTTLASSTVAGTYEEENPSASNPNQVPAGDRAEWDWVIQPNGASSVTKYYFRMVRSSSELLESYTRFPAITTPPAAVFTQTNYRWYTNTASTTPGASLAALNTSTTGAVIRDVFRLRMNLGVAGADLAAGAQDFRLQFTGGNTSTGPWSEVGVLPPLEIALDSSSSNSDTGAITTLTISQAVATNTNRVLVVGAVGEDDSASDCSITGVTYSSVALTQIDNTSVGASPTLCASLWYLLAPDVGTDNVVITYNGAVTRRSGGAISIYNAAQQPPEATDKQTLVSATSINTSVITLTDGAWLVDVVAASNGAAFTPTETGQTEQYDVQAGTSRAAGAIRDVPASGPTSMGWSKSSSDLAHIVAAFTPYSVSSTFDRVWRGFDNAGVGDGATLPSFLLASSTVAQSYEEENPSTTTPRAMSVGDFGEWDWVIEDNGAASGDYYFRMVTEDGTALDTYVNFPTINAAGPTLIQRDYQWYDNEDALTPTVALASTNTAVVAATHGKAYRLRMNVELQTVDLPAQTQAFSLQYSVNSTSGPWFDMGAVGSMSTDWAGFDNPGVVNGVTTTPLLPSSTVGESYEESNPSVLNPNALIVTTTVQRGEWDWVVEPAAAATVTRYYFRMVQSDGTELTQYARYPEITTPPAPVLRQNYYQWWENRTNITPDTQLQPVNTAHTGVDPLVTVRLRMNVELTAANMATSSESFKLQFATSTAGPWTDVGGDGSTDLWRGEVISGATTIDGDTLPTLLLTPTSTVAATFEEENPSAAIPNAIDIGDNAEWDWVLQNNTAPANSYFFRMVYEDGTPLTTYTTYPELSTSAPTYSQDEYQWFLNIDQQSPTFALAAENAPYTEASSPQVLRLRVNVLVGAVDLPASGEVFKLQYAVTTTGPWTDVGPTTSTGAWRGFDNPSVSDGAVISVPKLSNTDKRESYEESNPSVANLNSILTVQRGEWDWVIQNNNALSETRYYFRMVTVDGAALTSYLRYPQVSTTQPVVAFDDFESGGFSGGGGWLAAWTTAGDVGVVGPGSPKQGSFHMRLRRNTGYAARSVDLSGEDEVTLQFWAKANSFDGNESTTLSVSNDGVTFYPVFHWVNGHDDDVYRQYRVDLKTLVMELPLVPPLVPAGSQPTLTPQSFTNNYWIAFDANMSNGGDKFYVDDLKLLGD